MDFWAPNGCHADTPWRASRATAAAFRAPSARPKDLDMVFAAMIA